MRAHVIENGRIINTIVVDALDAVPELVLVDAELGGAIGDTYADGVFGAPAAEPLDRAAAARSIDAAVEAIYARPMLLSKEYEQREAAALAYQAAGYAGAVPARVQGFATPAGLTAQAAADLILAQAAQLRGALDQLSDLRMLKYQVLRAASDAAAKDSFDAVMADISAVAASLG